MSLYDYWIDLCQQSDIDEARNLTKKLIEKVKYLEERIEHLEKYSHQHMEKKEAK